VEVEAALLTACELAAAVQGRDSPAAEEPEAVEPGAAVQLSEEAVKLQQGEAQQAVAQKAQGLVTVT
jgi:hypothetical protein